METPVVYRKKEEKEKGREEERKEGREEGRARKLKKICISPRFLALSPILDKQYPLLEMVILNVHKLSS